jgi:hypothetical protein
MKLTKVRVQRIIYKAHDSQKDLTILCNYLELLSKNQKKRLKYELRTIKKALNCRVNVINSIIGEV